MASSPLPPLVGVLRGDIGNFVAKMGEAKAAAAEASGFSGTAFKGMAGIGKAAFLGIAAGAIAVGAISVKMAGDFQTSMTQLVTGAGESRDNIGLVSKGILSMAGEVGISAQQLAAGMYNIESAGYHGAAALNVLKASAEGAKVGGADMATVADALTTALNAYKGSGLNANQVTNDLVATVASGKMHMQDLASSLGAVLPAASAAHVGLQDVTAAIATMTSQGTPAADAATYLRQTMLQLENPSAKAQKALLAIGMTSNQVHDMLANPDVGLNGGLQVITDALSKKFGYGSQQYIAHLANIVGGTKSMQAALELTGPHMKTYNENLLAIGKSTAFGKDKISGWSDVQKDFNFQVDQAKSAAGALAISIGTVLIPYLEKGARIGIQFANYLAKHREIAIPLAVAIGGVLVVAIGAYTISMVAAAAATVAATWPVLAIIAAIALLTAGVIYAYNHWGWFRNAVNAAGAELKVIFGWIQKNVPPIWSDFVKGVTNAWNGMQAFGSWITNTFGGILKNLSNMVSGAGKALNALNPFAKHSPSLVENVQAGTALITQHYATMARAVGSSMGNVPGFGSPLQLATAGGIGTIGGAGAQRTSRTEDLLQQILDALKAGGLGGLSLSVTGTGTSPANLARAMNSELAWQNFIR